jgi:hypothetical protein
MFLGLSHLCFIPANAENPSVSDSHEDDKENPKRSLLLVARLAILCLALAAVIAPFVWPRQQITVKLAIEVCGGEMEYTGQVVHGNIDDYNATMSLTDSLQKCPDSLVWQEKWGKLYAVSSALSKLANLWAVVLFVTTIIK